MDLVHWLWLPVLLAAAAVLLASPDWRRSVKGPTIFFAALIVAAALGELAWRLLGAGTTLPWSAWAVTLFFLASALSTLRRGPAAPEPAAGRHEPAPDHEAATAAPAPGDPLRSQPPPPAAGDNLKLAFEQTSEGMAVLDLEGQIELVNTAWARLHGYRADEVQGHHVSLFYTPDQMQRKVRPWMVETLETGARRGGLEHRKKDGTTFRADTSLTLLRDAVHEPVGFVALAREAAKGEPEGRPAAVAEAPGSGPPEVPGAAILQVLARGVAHDFNNLLTAILGHATLARQKLTMQGPETVGQKEIGEIETAARRAADLSRLLQAYAGEVEPVDEFLRLDEVLAPAAAALAEVVAGRGELTFDLADELPPISGDPEQIRRVVRNLVANAADAVAGEGGGITLRTGQAELERQDLAAMELGPKRAPGAYVFVEVADTGAGMDDKTRERVFEPFFTTRVKHQGVGLATVRGLVRGQRGAIRIDSTPGEGTRVRVYFPVAEPEEASATPPAAAKPEAVAAPAPGPQEGRSAGPPQAAPQQESRSRQDLGTILVVDNEKIIRDLAAGVLETHGYSVMTADDGEPAVELYRRHHGDIRAVLLDLSMPIMDGEEAFRLLREIDPQARVILMTGHAESDVMADFADRQPSGFLQKPFRPDQLIGKLRGILEG